MAKKAARKAAKKPAKKSSKKSSMKPAKALSRRAGSGSARKAGKTARSKQASSGSAPRSKAAANPAPVKSGPGPTPMEVGQSLVTMFNRGQMSEIETQWWNPREITSVEGMGVEMAWTGKAAVDQKNQGWMADHVIHGASAEGPYVGASGFAVKFRMDVETRATGQRQVMEEIGVYTVRNGKIVREEFMYSSALPAEA